MCSASCTRAETEAAQRPQQPEWRTGQWSTVSNRSKYYSKSETSSNDNNNINKNNNNDSNKNENNTNKEQYSYHRSHRRTHHSQNSYLPSSRSKTTSNTATATSSSSSASSNRLHYRLPNHLKNGRRRTSSSNRLSRYSPSDDNRLQRPSDPGRYIPGINTYQTKRRNTISASYYDRNRTDSNRLRYGSRLGRNRNSLNRRRNYRIDARTRHNGQSQYRNRQVYNNYRHSNIYNSYRHPPVSAHTSQQRKREPNPTGLRQDYYRRRWAYQRSGQERPSKLLKSQQEQTQSRRTIQNERRNTTMPLADKKTSERVHSSRAVNEESKKARPNSKEEYATVQRPKSKRLGSAYFDRDRSRRYHSKGIRRRRRNHYSRQATPSTRSSVRASHIRQRPNNSERFKSTSSSSESSRNNYHSFQRERRKIGQTKSRRSEQRTRSPESERLEGLAKKATELLNKGSKNPALRRGTMSYPNKFQARSGGDRADPGPSRRYGFFSENPESAVEAKDTSSIRSGISTEQGTKGSSMPVSIHNSLSQLTHEERREMMHSDAVKRRHERRRRGKG